jgi:predicted Zn-dependent protease
MMMMIIMKRSGNSAGACGTPAISSMGHSSTAMHDNEKAIQAALRATALDPNDADSEVLAAGLFLRVGDSAKAKPYALRAVQLWPQVAATHMVLAKVYLAEDNPNSAITELKQAIAGDTDESSKTGLTGKWQLRQLCPCCFPIGVR